MAPLIGHEMGLAALGTFHQRQGDQSLLSNDGPVSAAWGRAFGESRKQRSMQSLESSPYDLTPEFDGEILGLQAGLDLIAQRSAEGRSLRLGVAYSHVEADGDVTAVTLTRIATESGADRVKGDYLSLYATFVDPSGWYVDAVGQYGWLNARALSNRALGALFDGSSVAASLESGYPIAIAENWRIEPQAQVVWQRTSFDDTADRFADITFEDHDRWMGRLGLRLEGDMTVAAKPVQPYLDVNYWHAFGGTTEVAFDETSLTLEGKSNLLKVGAGVSAQLSEAVGVYLSVDWGTNLDGLEYESLGGLAGFRLRW